MEMEKRKGNKNRETINQKLTKLVVQVKFKLRHMTQVLLKLRFTTIETPLLKLLFFIYECAGI